LDEVLERTDRDNRIVPPDWLMIAPVLLDHFESGSRLAADPVSLRWTER
jgi:hypothetical protein